MLTTQTAGLTSGAVQAPGSGADIIHQHQIHRSESEAHLAAQQHAHDVQKTDSSGGYTDLTDTDGNDEHGQQEMLYLDDEYEDEEDRLIAQGGCGIPCDEVRLDIWSVLMLEWKPMPSAAPAVGAGLWA